MRLWCSIFLVCFLLPSAGTAVGQKNTPFKLERVDIHPGLCGFEIGDVDGDGVDEIVELRAGNKVYFSREFSREMVWGPALYQATSPCWTGFVMPIDIDTTPGMELALSCKDMKADSVWLTIVTGADKSRVLCRTQAVHGVNLNDRNTTVHPGWDGSIIICEVVDLDNDGVREIVLSVNVSFDLYPRGLYVYKYPSGRLLWRFPMAGNPYEVEFGDADGDGYPEIFAKTWADANGAIVGDQSDTTAEIFALDHTGRLLWRTCTGDRFDFHSSDFKVCDCDRDGALEIYYGVLLRPGQFDRQVQVLEKHRAADNRFLQQLPFDAGRNFGQVDVGSMRADSLDDIILDNGPSIIDPRTLSVIAAGPYPLYAVACIPDLERKERNIGRGAVDTSRLSNLILRKNDSLYIVGHDFRLLAAYATETGKIIDNVRYFRSPFGGDYLGVMVDGGDGRTSSNTLYILEIKPVHRSLISTLLADGRGTAMMVAAAFLLGIPAGIVLVRMRDRRRRENGDHLATYGDLLSALTAFGHGQTAGRNLTRLAFLISNLPETRGKAEEILPNIHSALSAYRSISAGQIESIVVHGRRMARCRAAADELAGHLRRLNAVIEPMSSAPPSLEQLHGVKVILPREIEAVRRIIRQLEATVQPLFGSDPVKVIVDVLASCAGTIRQHDVRTSQVTVLGDYRHLTFFPPTELAAILEELVTNACRAMAETPVRNLSFRLEYASDRVLLDVSDTGGGIGVNDPELLFSRQYSTKGQEGGFGLFHARQRIERFGGRIRIFNNADGRGATVRMTFKGISRE